MKKEVFLRGAAIVTAAVLLVLTGCASVDSYIKKGDLAKAEQAAGKLESPQEKESALILIADEYKKTGNKEKHAQIYTNLGDGYAAANNEDYALKMYEQAANTDKIYPIYQKRAEKFLTDKNDYMAISNFQKAGLTEQEAKVKVGDSYEARKDFSTALSWYEKAQNPEKIKSMNVRLGDADLAKKQYDSAMKLYTAGGTDIITSAKKIAEAAEKNGDSDFAAPYYEKAGDKDKAIAAYAGAADKLLEKGEFDKALSYYEKAGDKAKTLAAYSAAADKLLSKNEFDKALDYFAKAGKSAEGKTKVAEARRKFDIQKAVNALFGVYSSYRSGYSTEADMIKRRNDIIINADINIIDDIFKTAVDQATETAKDYNTRAMAAFSSGSFDYSSMAVMERNVNEAKYYIAVAQDLIAVKDALIKGLEGAVKK